MKIVICFIIYFLLFLTSNFFLKKKEKYKNIIFLLFMFSFSFYLSIGVEYYIREDTIKTGIHSVFLAIIVCLIMVISRNVLKLGLELFFFIPLFIFLIIDYLTRTSDYSHYYSILFTYLSIFLIFLIFRSLPSIKIEPILTSVNYLAFINAILGIAQFITGKQLVIGHFNDSIEYTEGIVATNRAIGLAGTNNAAGNFGALLFGVVLYNYVNKHDKFSLLTLILTSIFSILTFTRIGYVGILLEFFILVAFNKKWSTKKIIVVIFQAVLGLFAIIMFSSKIINKLFIERGDTQEDRFLQFDIVKKYIINDHWLFGIGTGQYRDYLYKNYSIFGPDIHSQYLNVMAENGIFIFILFVLFNCWIIEKIISSNTGRLLKILGVALFIGNFVCSNFNPNQYYYLNNILYYLVMLTIAFYSKKKI
jgi:lysylphosphatidylglycerol synthetase-like protein (DUF2156 family)